MKGLSVLTLKTVNVRSITYYVAGILAYTLGGYEKSFSQPPLSYLMRPTSDPLVMAGPLFQPIRGVIFASALYPLRNVVFAGLWEVLLQSLLFSFVLFYWVNHPGKPWLNWTLGIVFSIVMLLPLLGLVASP